MAEDDQPLDTSMLHKAGVSLGKNKLVIGGGTGLSAAALIYIYSVFATQSDLNKLAESQAVQWKQMSAMKDDYSKQLMAMDKNFDDQIAALQRDVRDMEGRNAAYDMLLRFLSKNNVYYDAITNTNK